ncbi:hypothetical protein AMJ44_07795 [candidate division WOR-1 bacterium DG_54_3]|uniref:DUF3108 domain-containing protein n=1 Tax=candidate division WOR-1 bacterium DG_54_3 TaxID=1703775 RepID=A0A0S7XX30_UNCSA|nr:MAG: hypothetical protein AMJ44_07795 [candidate division WOR-1 bacterium DG_54_3]
MFSHKFFTCVLLLVAFLLIFSQTEPLVAQVPGILGLPKMSAEFKMPKVGTYVKYKSTNEKTKTESILKLSIVGQEKLEGEGEFFWYEIEQTEPKTGGVTIIKMLISGDPKDQGTVKRMIFKSGKEPANELPQAFVNLMNQVPKDTTKAVEPKPKKLGTEKIETKMGTFKCAHTQSVSPYNQVTDSWTHAEVPMFGIVKSTSGSNTLVLLEHGTGAVTAIKEKPKVLEMPGQK